jgi:hypothetical protein
VAAELRIEGAAKFGTLAKALKQAGDKELRKELYAGINRAVKPLSESVKVETKNYLPRRYAFELAKSLKVKARRRAGRDPSVRLVGQAKTPRGKERDLRSLNRGRLRHPLYGNRGYWYNQEVPPNWWDDPLLEGVEPVREELVNVLEDIAHKLEQKMK